MITVFEQPEQNLVSPFDLKPGQFGVIVKWGNYHEYVGKIVFRTEKDLISADPLLALRGENWTDICNKSFASASNYSVRVLPPGTKLLLTVEDHNKIED